MFPSRKAEHISLSEMDTNIALTPNVLILVVAKMYSLGESKVVCFKDEIMKYLIVSLVVFLAACGGGNGESDSDPLNQYFSVEGDFSGSDVRASITPESVGTALNSLFWVAPELGPGYSEHGSGTDALCIDGGNVSITSGSNGNEKNLLFKQCQDGAITISGSATFRAHSFDEYGRASDATTIYQDVEANINGESYILRGTARSMSLDDSCPVTQTTFNMLFTGQNQVWFDNFVFKRTGDSRLLCGSGNGIVVYGDLVDSQHGRFKFSTTEMFTLKSMVPLYDAGDVGLLKIQGADNQAAYWGVDTYPVKFEHIYTTDSRYYIDINGEYQYQFRLEGSTPSMLTKLVDSDGDGLTDGWELHYGLNPYDDSDALSDLDGDGISNLDEFLYLGDPLDPNIEILKSDISVSLSSQPVNYGKSIDVDVKFENHQPNGELLDINTTYAVTSGFYFDSRYFPSNCQLVSEQQLDCTMNMTSDSIDSYVRVFTNDQELGQLEGGLTVTLDWHGTDVNLDNNSDTVELVRLAYNPIFSARVREGSLESLILYKGDQATFSVSISQDFESGSLGSVYMQPKLPSNLELLKFECSISGDWVDCDETTQVEDDYHVGIYRLTVKAIDEGKSPAQMIMKHRSLGDHELASIEYPVWVGKSSEYIQSQVEAASAGDVIRVSPGVYIGSLDLSQKLVHLQAEQSVDLVGMRRSDGRVYLGKGGSISGFNIVNLRLDIVGEGGKVHSNTFDGKELLLYSGNIYVSANAEITANRFMSHNITSRWNSVYHVCSAVEIDGRDQEQGPSVILQNNLLKGPIMDQPEEYTPCSAVSIGVKASLNASHNTVLGFYKWLSLSLYPSLDNLFDVSLTNNVWAYGWHGVYNNDEPEEVYPMSGSRFVLENNVWLNSREDFVGLDGYVELYNNQSTDPLVEKNGVPNSDSVLIDTALASGLEYDIEGTLRPQDGDGDGSAIADIGAFERAPEQ